MYNIVKQDYGASTYRLLPLHPSWVPSVSQIPQSWLLPGSTTVGSWGAQ